MKYIIGLFLLLLMNGCSSPEPQSEIPNNWEAILAEAKGKTVTMMMWQGDPLIQQYMKNYVIPSLKKDYDIDLNIVAGQGNVIVNTLMTEIEAGAQPSQLDMMWINGETFFQLRQIGALQTDFVDQLPNSQYIDWENPFIKYDFQQPVNGSECPWGNVQFAMIYNAQKVKNPPQNLEELEQWLKANPNKFTISNDFTGITLLKSWLIHFAGGKEALSGDFDEQKYAQASKKLWTFVNRIKPYFWNEGKTFPASLAQVHQLFANGELLMTMSNNDGEVDNKILQGVFDTTARAYVPDVGSIQNSHYLGIAKHGANKAAAMVVCNFLISPAAQWEKLKPQVWGDGTVLSLEKLPADWQAKFNSVPGRKYAPKRSEIYPKALMEPAPEYMIRLFEDFRKKVIEK